MVMTDGDHSNRAHSLGCIDASKRLPSNFVGDKQVSAASLHEVRGRHGQEPFVLHIPEP